MQQDVDEQTRAIVEYLRQCDPALVRRATWATNPSGRLADLLSFGAMGRSLLDQGRRAAGPRALEILSRAVLSASSRRVVGKALYYRGALLSSQGATAADAAIADLSLAIWCDPTDCWARKDRAMVYAEYGACYGRGDRSFELPMTREGALADVAAATDFMRELLRRYPAPEAQAHASQMLRECQALERALHEGTGPG